MKQNKKMILLAYQPQVNIPIFLSENGNVTCGSFTYSGRYKKLFSEKYKKIVSMLSDTDSLIVDVSNYQYWSAIKIYDEIIVDKWQESLSSEILEKLAKETLITIEIQDIKDEFIRSVTMKWKRKFQTLRHEHKSTLKEPWQLFLMEK